ncbi:MAG: DNA replication/repair protein RecF [Novosphingobium sp.]
MALARILLTGFRNHRETALDSPARFNLLVGENGAGKTNVLEAISLLAPGRGLRRAGLSEIAARDGDGSFAVSATLSLAGGTVTLGTGIGPERTGSRPARRIVQVNGADAPALRLAEWLSIGWLTPGMDRIFAEGPGARRRFLDRMALAVEPGHARQAARLEAALRERNRLLAGDANPDPAWLDGIEAQLAVAGAAVASARAMLVARLDAALAGLPDSPFARPSLAYVPGGPIAADALAAALREGRRRDRAAQRTLTGPHRDDLAVTMAATGLPAGDCSTGEQKAMLVAITLAHANLFGGLLNADLPRLLLLDEIAAHLDPLRREALFERLRAGPAQVWMTGTEAAPFSAIMGEAAVWRVSGGRAERL